MGINIEREKILLNGFANQASIRKFIPCGYVKAKRIYEEITLEANNEDKCTKLGFDPKRLLKYVNLTKKEIFAYAEIEKKETAKTVPSKML